MRGGSWMGLAARELAAVSGLWRCCRFVLEVCCELEAKLSKPRHLPSQVAISLFSRRVGSTNLKSGCDRQQDLARTSSKRSKTMA